MTLNQGMLLGRKLRILFAEILHILMAHRHPMAAATIIPRTPVRLHKGTIEGKDAPIESLMAPPHLHHFFDSSLVDIRAFLVTL